MSIHRFSAQAASFVLAAVLTVAMLASVNLLSTSAPPAGLVAQMAQAAARA